MEPRRILLLTSSTGSGHDRRAYALRDWFLQLDGEAEVRVEHILENSSLLLRFGVWVYNVIQRSWPGLHQVYWWIAEAFGKMQSDRLVWGRRYTEALLRSYRPHLVVSLHDSTNGPYFRAAKAVLGKASVRCATYCGEFSGGPGFSRIWLTDEADWLAVRTDETRQWIREQAGWANKEIEVLTNLFRPNSTLLISEGPAPLADEQQRREIRLSLGLDPSLTTILLATGAQGANRHLRWLRSLLPFAGKVQVVAVCGRNKAARNRVERWRQRHDGLFVRVEGYTDRMQDYLVASDCVVTRPGSNTAAEALAAGCQPIWAPHQGIMPQEQCTVRWFAQHGFGQTVRRGEELTEVMQGMLSDFGHFAAQRERFHDLRASDHPRALLKQLLGLADEARGSPDSTSP